MRIPVLLALCVAAVSGFGTEVNLRSLQSVAESYFSRKPAPGLPIGLSFDDAMRAQRSYVQLLVPKLGPPVGHKVGVVTKAGQERYKIDHPVRGVLLRDMLLTNRSVVPAQYGARPLLEPDLMVRVKDDDLNEAKTPVEAARHLSHIIAFIELADGTFDTNAPFDAGVMVAGNVGARLGVLGEERAVDPSQAFVDAFGKMSLVLKDGGGHEHSRVSAEGMMGHPLNPLLWFLQDLKKRGQRVKAGDLISLGSPSPAVTPAAGKAYTLVYEGLPGGPLSAAVSIR